MVVTQVIPHPSDFSVVRLRVAGRGPPPRARYTQLSEFAGDMRRVISNCIRFNFVDPQIRREAIKLLLKFEKGKRLALTLRIE